MLLLSNKMISSHSKKTHTCVIRKIQTAYANRRIWYRHILYLNVKINYSSYHIEADANIRLLTFIHIYKIGQNCTKYQ